MTDRKVPAGALDLTRLQNILEDFNDPIMNVEVIRTYAVHALGEKSFISIVDFVKGQNHISTDKNYHHIKYRDIDGIFRESSVLDRNLRPNNYNDHYMFSNAKLALKYYNFCKTNPAMIKRYKEHEEYCLKLFAEIKNLKGF